jgi:N-acetylmuramic acid 6-phosphate etherase
VSGSLPPTEAVNPRSRGLDVLAMPALIALLVDEQAEALEAVRGATAPLARAAETIARRLADGGRLHYVGAGSSGRLGVLDAAEMPPTFGTPPNLVCAHIAGGNPALTAAVEGAEDDREAGIAAMRGHVVAADAVVGISASGGAPYVVAAIESARAAGAFTVALVNAEPSPLGEAAELRILLASGAEALAGSTRMKAGTAQKIALNALSTAVMVRLGKVYDNLMVDVVATNRKLRGRATRLVSHVAGVDAEHARELLARSGGSVKLALVMHRHGVDAGDAAALLARHRGSLRSLL